MFRCVPTRPIIENSKKTAKKFKKLENTIVAFLQAKIGQERPRKREKKKKKLFRCGPTQPVIENSKKIPIKYKKHHQSFFSGQNRIGKVEKEIK